MVKHDRWAESDILAEINKREYRVLEVRVGMTLTHTGSSFTGTVAEFTQGGDVVLTDTWGEQQTFPAHDGAFMHNGSRVSMREPTASSRAKPRFTPSGSIDAGVSRARIARASRIWVEGVHDAELIEKIWGDDLREAAVVVEPLHGVDELVNAVAGFAPSSTRRLGVLLDHLVAGSKESHIADAVRDSNVLICGHPYVDIWAAIKPATIGIASWPDVPPSEAWKEGVIKRLGLDMQAGYFWGSVLDAIASYRDVETPLVNAVEQLIDFVTNGNEVADS
jgi:hypothetical protein